MSNKICDFLNIDLFPLRLAFGKKGRNIWENISGKALSQPWPPCQHCIDGLQDWQSINTAFTLFTPSAFSSMLESILPPKIAGEL